MPRLKLHWQILIALALAVLVGWAVPADTRVAGVLLTDIYSFIGRLFLRSLQMLVVPLIVTAIVSGVAKLGQERSFGRLGAKSLGFYLGTTLLAVIIGLVFVNVMRPGDVSDEVRASLQGLAGADGAAKVEQIGERSTADIVAIFERMIPTNFIAAASDNREMLAVIVFSLIFGYFIAKLPTRRREAFTDFWETGFEVIMAITNFVIRFAPIGVFGLVAATVASTGPEVFRGVFVFFLTVLVALLVHFIVSMSLVLRFAGGVKRPWLHYKAMAPALLTSFSTASSAATIPVTLECLRTNAKVSQRVSGFTVPLGATVNMNGTALYECVAVIFIAQVFGVSLTFGDQFLVVMLALLTSIGVAGIPSASLVAIIIILGALGLPLEAIGMLLAVDRILDMCRTSVNIFGDSVAAVVIARTEGEKGIYEPLTGPADTLVERPRYDERQGRRRQPQPQQRRRRGSDGGGRAGGEGSGRAGGDTGRNRSGGETGRGGGGEGGNRPGGGRDRGYDDDQEQGARVGGGY
jgi:proton glutamate symport protein